MRELVAILSQRKTSHWPSFGIVYEWEDILSKELGIRIKSDGEWQKKYYRRFELNGLTGLYNALLPKKNLHLDFLMEADLRPSCRYNKNTILIIIDFWLKKEDLPDFYTVYKNCPLILLTNMEVYNLLRENGCPIPIAHLPLSYPDIYRFSSDVMKRKEFEFCLFGRPNPLFVEYTEEYAKRHPDFSFLITKGSEKNREFYTNTGELVCRDTGRESYLNIIQRTRITCYSTPGMDLSKKGNGACYNQVTPRLFEMLCNGCHVIGHYPDSADTNWYNLKSIIPNINTYSEFEEQMDYMRGHELDINKIAQFMNNHYTSNRANMLKSILKQFDIQTPTVAPSI